MITLDKLAAVKHVFSHRSCPDGTASAMVCARALSSLGVRPEFHFIQYGTNEHDELQPGPGQLFVDITPPISRWKEWEDFNPIVLDHHETAKPAVIGLGGTYGWPNESGATLAFQHVMKPIFERLLIRTEQTYTMMNEFEHWERFANLCRIRDTWQDSHDDFDLASGISHALMFYGSKDLVDQASTAQIDFKTIEEIGKSLYSKLMHKVELYAKTAYRFETTQDEKTYKIGIFNCTEKAISEVGHALLESGCDIAVGYFMLIEDDDVCISVSLRSHKDGVQVNKIAEFYGGGGHPPAAGFRIKNALKTSLEHIKVAVSIAIPSE